MLSQIPINLDRVKKEDLDKEILRAPMIAEMEYRSPFLLSKQIYLWKEYRYVYPPRDDPYDPYDLRW